MNAVNYQYSANISISVALLDLRYTDILLTSYMKIFFFPHFVSWKLAAWKKKEFLFFGIHEKIDISSREFLYVSFFNFFTFHVYLLSSSLRL